MATLPHNLDATPRFLDAEELLALRGTPDFEMELHRQMSYLADQDRKVKPESRFPIDWESINKVWQ